MDPNSQESSNSQNPFRFPSFMNMLGNQGFSQTSSNSNMPYNYQVPSDSLPQPNATLPRFYPPPYCPIPPNFYPQTFQSFRGSSYPPTMMHNTQTVDTPQYCTQVDQQEDDVHCIPPPIGLKKTMWSSTEDELLISAWLNTSKDAIIGTDQRGTAFWKRIEKYFMENKTESAVPRSCTQCKHRWQKICKSVAKFVGCYEEANQQKRSGQSSTDVYNMAKKIYSNDGRDKAFIYEDAWNVLKFEPKWMSSYCGASYSSGGSSKRTKINEVGGYSSNSCPTTPHSGGDDEAPPIRPPGVKACKKKGKQVRKKTFNSNSTNDYEGLITTNLEAASSLDCIAKSRVQKLKQKEEQMKQKDEQMEKFLEAKRLENHTRKMDMLMTLMAQGDTLTVAQQQLRDKLVEELL